MSAELIHHHWYNYISSGIYSGIRKKKRRFNFDLISCLGDDVTPYVCSAVFGSKMIVINVAVAPVYSFWHITMCAGHVSHYDYIVKWYSGIECN